MMQNSGSRASSQTLKDFAYDRIRTEILEGSLPPGTAISEAERADWLGISRSPVREALQQLAIEGLVEIFPKRGTFVAELTPKDVREAFELREAIETACARLAAERRTHEDIADLTELCNRIDLASTVQDAYDLSAAFHAGVARVARSKYLQEAFETTRARIDMASRAAADSIVHHDRELTHRDILEAIVRSDGVEAERIMRAHLEESARSLIGRLL